VARSLTLAVGLLL